MNPSASSTPSILPQGGRSLLLDEQLVTVTGIDDGVAQLQTCAARRRRRSPEVLLSVDALRARRPVSQVEQRQGLRRFALQARG